MTYKGMFDKLCEAEQAMRDLEAELHKERKHTHRRQVEQYRYDIELLHRSLLFELRYIPEEVV